MQTLQRRHPDMIWSADTVNGEKVLFLLEFQRTIDRLMALRTTTYTTLTLEGVAAGPDFRPGNPLPEFVYLVLYHGDGPWTAPARVADLFQRSDPGRYRLVPWEEGTGDDRSRHDLTALILGLARNLSPEGMATQLSALWRAVETNADPGLDGFVVRTVATMLELRDYPEALMKGGAKTMAEVVDRFQQGMDELVQRGVRQGIEQGIQQGRQQGIQQGRQQGRQQGQAVVLRRMIERRFGEETAGRVAGLLGKLTSPEGVDRVTDALLECDTGEEFIERLRTPQS